MTKRDIGAEILAGINEIKAHKQGKISLYSPLARAVIGKNEGDSFEVETPGGKRAFKIISVEYI